MTDLGATGERIAVLETRADSMSEDLTRLEKLVSKLVYVTAQQGEVIRILKWIVTLAIPLAVAVATVIQGVMK